MRIDSARINVTPSGTHNQLTATRYSYIVKTSEFKEVGFELGCVGTGSPVGTWSFEGSDDPRAEADYWTEQYGTSEIGSSNTATFVTLTSTTVNGSALAITGSGATKSFVSFALGIPAYVRAVFTYSSGGSSSSTSYVYANVRQ